MRQIINLNKDWLFRKTTEFPDVFPGERGQSSASEARWEPVTIPHTWNAEDGQDGGNDYYRGTCMYTRLLRKPEMEPGGRAVLEFKGAAMSAEVTVNGERVARHEGGYSTFRADITDVLTEGDNLICVSVDNSENDRIEIRKVQEPNPDYFFRKQDVVNWFDREDIDPTCLSIHDTMGEVMATPQGAAILGRMIRL